MRFILFGPPGSGKGTQAKLLSAQFALIHIGTGDILRDAVARKTFAGQRAEPFVTSGRLVADDLVNELVADRFRHGDRLENFVMDGYPRTLAQAASFDQVLRQQFLNLDAVIMLSVKDDEIIKRLAGRWSCPSPACKATYHVTKNPPRRVGICDDCQTPLLQRDDDKEETIRLRLKVYHRNIKELAPHYVNQGLWHEVNGEGDIKGINAEIVRVLKQVVPPC